MEQTLTTSTGTLDRATLATIIDCIKASVRSYNANHGYILSEENCKDLSQDAALKAIHSWKSFNPEKGSLNTWVSRITINCINDHWRDQSNWACYIDGKDIVEPGRFSEDDPHAEYCTKERHDWLMSHIQKLNPRERKVVMDYSIGYKPNEIARRLGGVSSNAVSILLCNAKQKLIAMARTEHSVAC